MVEQGAGGEPDGYQQGSDTGRSRACPRRRRAAPGQPLRAARPLPWPAPPEPAGPRARVREEGWMNTDWALPNAADLEDAILAAYIDGQVPGRLDDSEQLTRFAQDLWGRMESIARKRMEEALRVGDVVSFDYLEGRREGTIQGIVQPRDAGGERLYLVGVVESQHHPFRKRASELTLVRRAG